MIRVFCLNIALSACLIQGVSAQSQPQTGYYARACIKVRDGKMAEARKFIEEHRKLVQAVVDSGPIGTVFMMRSVMPAGETATCDLAQVTFFKGAPPAPPGVDAIATFMQKAGMSESAAEFLTRRDSLMRLVSSEMWQTAVAVGNMQKGDYAFINHMKVHDMPAWMELERSIWKPMAESWVKDGSMRGWLVSRPVLPGGTGLPYQAVTVDVVPAWDNVFKALSLEKTFKQVHSDKNLNEVMEKIGKARDLALRELFVVDDKVVPTTTSSKSTGGQ